MYVADVTLWPCSMKILVIVCDDLNELYHGERPMHGPLSELDSTAGDDQASLVYTQLPVPAQLSVRPSVIPGAGLGIFVVSLINKGVWVGPYEGRKVAREDMEDLYNTAYAWEVSDVCLHHHLSVLKTYTELWQVDI